MSYVSDAIAFVTELSTDTLLLVLLLIGFFAAALYFGKGTIISFIFSLFIADLLYGRVPFDLPVTNPWYAFGTVIILALIITSVIRRFIATEFPFKNSKKYTQALFLSLAAVITLLVSGLTDAYNFSTTVATWFTGDFVFWASLAALAILLFIIRK